MTTRRTTRRRLAVVQALAAFAFTCAALNAAEYYVDNRHPGASDGNPGTRELPWRTIQHAADNAAPGDTVHVMPGVYPESVVMPPKPAGGGSAPVRFLASGDGPAIIDGAVRLGPDDFEPTEERGVFSWTPPEPFTVGGWGGRPAQPISWVFIGDTRLRLKEPAAEDEPRLTTADVWSFSRGREDILVNFDGRGVPDGLDIEVSFRPHGFSVPAAAPPVHIRGFVLRRQAVDALRLGSGEPSLAEDCHIIQTGARHGIISVGQNQWFRRIRVYNSTMWGANFYGRGHVVQELVFQTCGERLDPAGGVWVGSLKSNSGSFQTWRHNLVIDRPPGRWQVGDMEVERDAGDFPFSGIWGDMHNYGNRIYGNSSVRVPHAGIYVEYWMNRNIIMWNTVQDSAMGITFRGASYNTVMQNWIFDSEALGIGPVDTDMMAGWGSDAEDHPMWGRQILDGLVFWHGYIEPGTMRNVVARNLVQVSGRFVSIPVPTWIGEGAIRDAIGVMCLDRHPRLRDVIAADLDYRRQGPDSFLSPVDNYLEGNYYATNRFESGWNAGFALFLDEQIETFEEFRDVTGLEQHGRAGDFTPSDIGLQICWTIPHGSRYPDMPIAFDYDGGAERGAPGPSAGGAEVWRDRDPEPYSWFRTNREMEDVKRAGGGDPRVWTLWPACRSGLRALAVINPDRADRIPGTGTGWRNISVPVKPGIEMEVGLYVSAADVEPVDAGGGVEVFVHFSDWTGHNVVREWLVGGGANPELTDGSYDWTRVERTITVPEGARRMIVYAGMTPATGSVFVDDMTMDMKR